MNTGSHLNLRGARGDLVTSLRRLADGWWHLAKDQEALEAHRGAELLEQGHTFVDVGHTTYEVTDAT